MKRLFIAINLPDNIKNVIEKSLSNLPKLAGEIRFLSRKNWHLTISFLGYQPDEAIGPILESIKETVKNFPAPTIKFEKVIWAPPDKPARMIWLTGSKETSELIGEIKNYLEDSLVKNGVRFRIENRPYNAHLTLARFNLAKPDLLKEVKLPNIENLSFEAGSLDLMESHLKRIGAEYEVLTKLTFLMN